MHLSSDGTTLNTELSTSPLPELQPHQEYHDISPSPPPADQEPTNVMQAIHDATPERRYALLCEIVTLLPAAKELAEKRLLVPAISSSGPGQTNLKRKAYDTCGNCKEEYGVEGNRMGDCVFHEGEKEVNYECDFWADHDDSCHGDPESFVDDPNYEEGFRWNCCDQEASAEGCVVSKHVPKKALELKKMRTILVPVPVNAIGSAAASFRGPGGRSVVS